MIKYLKNIFNKKPAIRFYSLEPGLHDVYPVFPANQLKRDWLKDQEQSNPINGHMPTKNCPGIKLINNAGWILPAPADFYITTNGDGVSFEWDEKITFSQAKPPGNEVYVGYHDQEQTEKILDDSTKSLKTVVKINTPWRVELPKDKLLLQLPVSYNNEDRFTSAIGILDPTYVHVLNVQLFWHKLNGKTLVRAGTPLAQFIPIDRNSFTASQFNCTIESANKKDIELETAFNYTMLSTFLHEDSLKSRLQRVRKVIDKYRYTKK